MVVKRSDPKPLVRPWTAKRIALGLVSHFGYRDNFIMPEFDYGCGPSDVVLVSRAGYLTDFEIKISLEDWKADLKKDKWTKHLDKFERRCARFYYVVPPHLADKLPDGLPDHAGLIVMRAGEVLIDRPDIVRVAKTRKVKCPWAHEAMFKAAYYRYWQARMSRLGEARMRLRGER